MLLGSSTLLKAEKIMVGNFSAGSLLGWQQKKLDGQTYYALKRQNHKIVLESDSTNAASGLFKEVSINLNKTPIIHWSWKIKNTLQSNNEREKSGDDFAARIYIIFSDGPFFGKQKLSTMFGPTNLKSVSIGQTPTLTTHKCLLFNQARNT